MARPAAPCNASGVQEQEGYEHCIGADVPGLCAGMGQECSSARPTHYRSIGMFEFDCRGVVAVSGRIFDVPLNLSGSSDVYQS